MSLIVHRARAPTSSSPGLADLLRDPLEDPFAQELVLVPARGVERWLSQRLSHRLGHGEGREDGVCAGVEFRSPASLVAELVIGGRHPRARPVVARRAGLAAARGGRRPRRRGLVPGAEPAPRPRRGRRGGRAPARASLCRGPAAGAAVRVVRRAATDPARATGRPAATATVPGARSTPTSPGSPSSGDCWSRRSARPRRASGTATCSRRCASDRSEVDLPARFSLFGHTRIPVDRGRAARLRWASTATSTSGCRTPRAALWDALTDLRGARAPERGRARTSGSATRCWPRSGRDVRELRADALPRWSTAVERPRRPSRNHRSSHAARLAAARHRRQRDRRPGYAYARPRRPQRAGARVPRPGAPGRGAARGGARPARRRPDARAARHPGDVPRHRVLRAADRGGVRDGSASRRSPRASSSRCGSPTGALTQTNPLLAVVGTAARPRRRAGRGERGARPGRQRAGAAPVRALRERPRDDHRLGRAGRDPLGLRRRPPGAVRPRGLRPEHLAVRARPGARRGGDVRRRGAVDRYDAAARRRRLHHHRPRRPPRRAARPAAARHRPADRQPSRRRLARRAPRRRSSRSPRSRAATSGRPRRCSASSRPSGSTPADPARRSSCGCPTSAR